MMKYFKLIGAVLLIIPLVSCKNATADVNHNHGSEEVSSSLSESNISSQTTENTSLDESTIPSTVDLYDRLDNETPKDQLIKTEYSLDSLQAFARNGSPYYGYAFAINDIDAAFPIECFRKVSEKFYYIVYKVKEGGYLYAHLLNLREDGWTGQNNGLELSNAYYVKEKSDIKTIKVGDSFTKVSTKDTNIMGNEFNFVTEPNNGETCMYSIHIDFDLNKMIRVTYQDNQSIEEIKQSRVKSIEECPDLRYTPEGFQELNYEYNYNLLDVDL